jgi:uncharacterized protein involved in outer membrane biogenesis
MIRMYSIGKYSVGRLLLRKTLTAISGLLALAFVGAASYILTQDMTRHIPGLGTFLSDQIGQKVTLEGPVQIDFAAGAALWVSLENMEVRPEGVEAYTASIGSARALVDVWPLLKKQISIRTVELDGTIILAESSVSLREAFGSLAEPEVTEGPSRANGWHVAALRRFVVNNSELRILDQGEEIFRFPISNASAEPGDIGLALRVDGIVEGREVAFVGKSGPWAALMKGHRVYLDGTISSESASLSLSGSVGDPSLHGVEFLVRGGADNLDDVATLFGYGDLTRASSMTISAHIKGTTKFFSVKDLNMRYGRGDLSGWFDVARGESLEVHGALVSEFLDLEAFEGGRFLHPPKKLFPDSALPVNLIGKLEGEVSFHAKTILLANARLVDGRVSVVASDGLVAINPIAVTYDKGSLDGAVVLDARENPGFKGSVSLVDFDLGKLLSAARMTDNIEAKVDFGARLRGKGWTIAEMFADASGQTNLIMGEGQLSSDILKLFGDQQAETKPQREGEKSEGEEPIALKCVVSRFDIISGVAKSRVFLLETSKSVTTGRGAINLNTESLDLRLAPRPKNPADLKSATDLRVTGSFLEPNFRVEHDKLSRGIAGSLGRFALARQGGEVLLPLVAGSATDNNACIVALTGQKLMQESASRVFNLSQVQ